LAAPHGTGGNDPEEQMMDPMGDTGEFDEIDMTEDEFDQMMASSESVTIDVIPRFYARRLAADGYYTLTTVSQSPAPTTSGFGLHPFRSQPAQASAVPSST
jgi:hypothetical protein